MPLVFSLFQQLSVFLVIAYLLSKTPLFHPLANYSVRWPHKVVIYCLFSAFCILGTYFGLEIQGAIANTRAVGAVLGGLLGGPLTGFFVGLTGGLHRWSLGGFTDLACAVSTTAEGLLGGLVHGFLLRRGRLDKLFSPALAFAVTLLAELLQMLIILLLAQPFAQAWALVQLIAPPMLLANATGAALFISMIRDQKRMFEELSGTFSAKALRIAQRTVGLLDQGLTPAAAQAVAQILYQETGVGAVAITDCHRILAFVGTGEDHHKPGRPISSPLTLAAISQNRLMFADGQSEPYRCSIQAQCPLGSVLVIPLQGEKGVLGTIKLYEPRQRLFLKINRTLGEGIANLLSRQLLSSRLAQQENLLTQAELKLLRAQINPHFLFNTLNTISAITRTDPERARGLLLHLSHFFRKNLKRQEGLTTLAEELEHCQSYLEIEQARFGERLQVDYQIPEDLLTTRLPAFTLQPLIENAIKHGIANLLEPGRLQIRAEARGQQVLLEIEDNAGAYAPSGDSDGLGLTIVQRRLHNAFGSEAQLSIHNQADCYCRVSLTLPKEAP